MRAAAGHSLAVLLALGCTVSGVSAGGDERLPYRLSVSVEWGTPRGPESFRQALQRQLVLEISAAGCFRAVDDEPPASPRGDELRLRLFVDGFEEQTDFEVGIAERYDPTKDASRLMVARLAADFHAQVQAPAEQLLVRERHFRQGASWRPLYREDPRERAQLKLIQTVVRTTRKFVCKGSAAAWSKQLEQARDEARR